VIGALLRQDVVRQILRFAGVGGVGFVVDGGILWGLIQAGGDPYLVRLISFPVAVLVTWWLNRIWTFSHASRAAPVTQMGRYLAVQIVGALSNFMVYAGVLRFIGETSQNALIAFAAGSAFGLFINFFGARRFAYTGQAESDADDNALMGKEDGSGV